MTDLEMTRLCAEAMQFSEIELCKHGDPEASCYSPEYGHFIFDPLNDDLHAMALVKRFGLVCDPQHDGQDFASDPGWEVTHPSLPDSYLAIDPSLNRAIVTCVARMQQAKSPPGGEG